MNSTSSRPRIYLAGPDVFHTDAAAIYRRLKAQCDLLGMEGVAPTDNEVDANLQDAGLIAQRIYEGNVALIRSADAVIANLQDFRGLEPDSGTVFEVGYAVALGKPVVAYGVRPGSYADRVAAAIPCMRADDGEWREVDGGVMVEGLGQRLNLMIARSTTIVDSAQAALDHLARKWGKARR
ncbi:nucleoside 2-deoxyribosyltransferase [Variovorax ginsengisoli]|uniref:Nucleoside 2-deoxyribosyltransferase n=1 Tax=Variovorax ginsengisoli TaxID=363844 RepID=A0ABT9SD24_9BURK|nr:nucleoside 2-deoxyribosyltransferase [Variovorax ginsengisoli]MDP9902250.1 nucleoside 2-deoxyribosyltransferase [Variovorax ginsengisoli]